MGEGAMNGRPWQPWELALLADMYPHCATEDVGEWIGRQPGSVYQAALARGIKKTPEYLQSLSSGRIQRGKQDERMTKSQFRPGLTPWNKGMEYRAGGRSAETQFKKGTRQGAALRNFVPVGTYRVNSDGILQQKVTATGYAPRDWKSVAVLVWERENGPVPAGHIVVFRPGMRTVNPSELDTSRLECISRAENARRNHPTTRSPELAKLIQLKGAITRQLNRIVKEHGNTTHQPTA
jgi:hypothetical protein